MTDILYTLPGDIHVIGEYSPSKSNPYTRVRILEHHLFDAVVKLGCQQIKKSRVVMTSILGRKLLITELVHHKNENREDDSPDNLEIISADCHNKHHKIGTKHSDKSKTKISIGMKQAFKEGRHPPLPTTNWIGRNHTRATKIKISNSHKKGISSGEIKKPIPPIMHGEDSGVSKLTDDNVIEIRLRASNGEKRKFLAEEFGVVIQSIYNIINKTTWRHIL